MADRSPINSYIAIAGLEADARRMIGELSAVVDRLRQVGQTPAGPDRDAAAAEAFEQFQALKSRIGTFTREAPGLLERLDLEVAENPYAVILGAFGLGVLLGRW